MGAYEDLIGGNSGVETTPAAEAAPTQEANAGGALPRAYDDLVAPKQAPTPVIGPRVARRPQGGQDVADWARGVPAGVAGFVRDLLSGDSRREFDLPELPAPIRRHFEPGEGQVAGKTALGANQGTDAARADLYRTIFPGAAIAFDKHGNAIATVAPEQAQRFGVEPGRYYLNRPGLSGQDLDDVLTQLLFAMGPSRLAGAATRAAPTVVRAGAVGGANAGASIAQDLASSAAGSEQGVDPVSAATNAVAAGAFEALGPIAGAVRRTFATNPRLYDQQTGTLTELGIEILQRNGIDPEAVTREFGQQFNRLARDAANPGEAAQFAAARTLPTPVPVTRGDISGDPGQQMFESQAFKGAYGAQARAPIASVRQDQQDALRANAAAIQARTGGRTDPGGNVAMGEGGQAAQARLVAMRDAERRGVDALYDTARGTRAGVPVDHGDGMSASLRQAVADDHDLTGLPRTSGLLDQFDAMMRQARELADARAAEARAAGNALPGGTPSFDINAAFNWRKRASNARASGGEEALAIGKAIREFDRRINETVERGLLQGDEEAVGRWRSAINAHSEFAGRWRSKDIVGDLVARDRDAGGRLKVAPEAAANYIFGVSAGGLASKPHVARELVKMRDILGADSPEWHALKEESFMRLMRSAEGRMEGGTQQFSGAGFRKAWDDLRRRNAPVVNELFSPQDQQLIGQFAHVAARTTNRVAGGDNPSNTSIGVASLVRNMFTAGLFGERGLAALLAMPGIRVAVNTAQTARSTMSAPAAGPRTRATAPGAFGATGAATYPDDE